LKEINMSVAELHVDNCTVVYEYKRDGRHAKRQEIVTGEPGADIAALARLMHLPVIEITDTVAAGFTGYIEPQDNPSLVALLEKHWAVRGIDPFGRSFVIVKAISKQVDAETGKTWSETVVFAVFKRYRGNTGPIVCNGTCPVPCQDGELIVFLTALDKHGEFQRDDGYGTTTVVTVNRNSQEGS
jgi:hypothetical protein